MLKRLSCWRMAAGLWPLSSAGRLLVLTSLLVLHRASPAASVAHQYDLTSGHVLSPTEVLAETSSPNAIQCALRCEYHDTCQTFNYRSSIGTCQLLPSSLDPCDGEVEATPRLTSDPGSTVGAICPRTCLQLLQQHPSSPSGVYRLSGWPVPVLCDQELDGGGWTLVLSSVTQTWTPDGTLSLVLGRNEMSPNMSDDYSILARGDHLISLGTGDRFLYRLEGLVDTAGRQQWGGIWSAPRSISSVVRHAPDVTSTLVTRFGDWVTSSYTLMDLLPWINTGYFTQAPQLLYVLTTSEDSSFWGTLVNRDNTGWTNSPWMRDYERQSGHVLYWMREDE